MSLSTPPQKKREGGKVPFYLKLPGPLPFLFTTAHTAAVVSLSIHLTFIHHSNLNYERQTSGAGQRVQDRADLLQGYLLDWAMIMKLTVIFQLSELTTILHTTTGLYTLALGSFTIVLLRIPERQV